MSGHRALGSVWGRVTPPGWDATPTKASPAYPRGMPPRVIVEEVEEHDKGRTCGRGTENRIEKIMSGHQSAVGDTSALVRARRVIWLHVPLCGVCCAQRGSAANS
ncbi:hypothetical protein GWK47_051655 [Chionoecetes opilio]|uniref:Uncharacterized protein n=1 Tax=Chionoecetes opilio TaxID=41210 RepID=A0A8J4Y9Q3_CHIOP|nr:hypothetical protein GWK47_051655 [Chionoecetes opilio]